MSPFEKFRKTIAALRHPETGCPWDLKQTHQSLKPYIIEESYEFLEAIDSEDSEQIKKELGDVLLQVFLHSQIASESGSFTVDDVLNAINEKIISRHPHVFGDEQALSVEDAKRSWAKSKQKESSNGYLDGIPKASPSLLRAERIGEKCSQVGFDWDNTDSVMAKVDEELEELKDEIQKRELSQSAIEEELGDLLFSICQLSRHLGLSPEGALTRASNKFTERFEKLEQKALSQKRKLTDYSKDELENLWQEVKTDLK